jgi:hypothetical protein
MVEKTELLGNPNDPGLSFPQLEVDLTGFQALRLAWRTHYEDLGDLDKEEEFDSVGLLRLLNGPPIPARFEGEEIELKDLAYYPSFPLHGADVGAGRMRSRGLAGRTPKADQNSRARYWQ